VNVFVPASGAWLAADRYVAGTGYCDMQPNAVDVSMVVAMLRATNDDPRRRNAVIELLELLCFFAHPLRDVVDGFDMLERHLNWHLHVASPLDQFSYDLISMLRRGTASARAF